MKVRNGKTNVFGYVVYLILIIGCCVAFVFSVSVIRAFVLNFVKLLMGIK